MSGVVVLSFVILAQYWEGGKNTSDITRRVAWRFLFQQEGVSYLVSVASIGQVSDGDDSDRKEDSDDNTDDATRSLSQSASDVATHEAGEREEGPSYDEEVAGKEAIEEEGKNRSCWLRLWRERIWRGQRHKQSLSVRNQARTQKFSQHSMHGYEEHMNSHME